ncbi:hypothetical protein PQZ12_01225 [Methylophilaceae bacterium]|nr:hypothetical protein [Methylophilaceae bacterium]
MSSRQITGIVFLTLLFAVILYLFGADFIIALSVSLPVSFLCMWFSERCSECGASWAKVYLKQEVTDKYTKEKYENGKKVQYRVTEYINYFYCKNCKKGTTAKGKSEDRI